MGDDTCPGRGIWAPGISHRNGEYRLYYSISTWEEPVNRPHRQHSLDPLAPGCWTDRGPVIRSRSSDNFNAIDPNAFDDAEAPMGCSAASGPASDGRLDPATECGHQTTASTRALRAAGGGQRRFISARAIIICSPRSTSAAAASRAPINVVGDRAIRPGLCRPRRPGDDGGQRLPCPPRRSGPDPTLCRPGPSILRMAAIIVYHAYDRQADGADAPDTAAGMDRGRMAGRDHKSPDWRGINMRRGPSRHYGPPRRPPIALRSACSPRCS